MGNTVKYNSHLFVVSPISSCDTFDFFTWKCKHRPYSIRKIHTLFPVLVHLSSVCNNVIVYVHYIPPPIHVYVSVCLSIYLSSVCMLVCTVSCQSVTLVSHTTWLSFVNVYVGTCPPICHIHVHYFPPLHVCQSVCDTLPCTRLSVFFFVSVCQLDLPIRHIHTHNVFHMCLCVCVFASICPYIMFTAMCPCVYLTVLIVFDYIVLAISTVVVLTTNVAVLAYRCMLRTLSFLTQRQRCFVHVSSF